MPATAAALAFLYFSLSLVVLCSIINWRTRAHRHAFPPGPKPLPIIGNMFDVPTFKPWIGFRDLCAKYGDIVHFRVFGQSIIVLGSTNIFSEFLDKHSRNTSERAQSPLIELIGLRYNFTLLPYGDQWRQQRRLFWQYFNGQAVKRYESVATSATHKLLVNFLRDPTELREHIRYVFSATILKLMYDIDAAEENDKFIAVADPALEGISQALVPGKFLVELLPFLRHVPAWFPGTGWKRQLAEWRAANTALKEAPFAHVKEVMARGESPQCVAISLLARLSGAGTEHSPTSTFDAEDIVKNIGAIAFIGGSDTTFSTLQSFLLAMSLYPRALQKAQAELDAIVGPHRLPDFSDRSSLVYVNAIILESLRWQNVLPLGVAHSTTVDSHFRGYFIPAGTTVIPNVWACMHDPDVFESPDEFRPERFIRDGRLDTSVCDPTTIVFGFGRRICPGRHFAQMSMFITVASILHVFDIAPPRDKNGKPIRIEPQMTDGLLSYPEDARVLIKPRSAEAEHLILMEAPDLVAPSAGTR